MQPGSHICTLENARECKGMHSQMDSHFGGWSFEFSNSDFRGQNLLIEKFLISLKISWDVDV
jgi:hypothetical protein